MGAITGTATTAVLELLGESDSNNRERMCVRERVRERKGE